MRFVSSFALALGLLPTVACSKSTGPALNLAVAEATASCAPNDGPAVAIRFTSSAGESPAPPVVQVSIFAARSGLAGKRWTLPSSRAQAWVQRTSALEYDAATEGRIAIDAVEADGTIRGTIAARFADGTRFDRRFRAPWIERVMLCG
jgi:hypothetical protein